MPSINGFMYSLPSGVVYLILYEHACSMRPRAVGMKRKEMKERKEGKVKEGKKVAARQWAGRLVGWLVSWLVGLVGC